jgi:nucleotide-binding universal stress UspA family protein
MTTAPPTSGSISTEPAVYLAAIDGTPSADHVLAVASSLAAIGSAAELHVLYVIADVASTGALMTAAPPLDLRPAGRLILDRATAYARERFSGKVAGHLGFGDPWRTIVQLASSLSADLVVVGTAGRTGIARLALGSVAEKVVRHAGCPVLVARPKDYHVPADVPIEPPCPDCLAVRAKTKRESLWCERHSAHHAHGQLHYELPPTFAVGSMNFRPE